MDQLSPEYLRAEFPGLVRKMGNKLAKETLEKLADRIQYNESYLDSFLTTLEINKIESEYHDLDKERIFDKVLDDLLIVGSFKINQAYEIRVKTAFSDTEKSGVLNEILREPSKAQAHFSLSGIEYLVIADNPGFKYPYVLKKTDAYGFITGIRVHPELEAGFQAKFKKVYDETVRKEIEEHLQEGDTSPGI